ncbi:MAG: hypothetical protein GY945_07265 [Rhodobacteraceae bacterium]|nr:hypothetical protein [Paracoccaceae bacterium]
MTGRTAQNFMQVAEKFSGKSETVSHLNTKALYALAAPSTSDETREKVEELLLDGESITVDDIKQMKSAASEKQETLEAEVARLKKAKKEKRDNTNSDDLAKAKAALEEVTAERDDILGAFAQLGDGDVDAGRSAFNQMITDIAKGGKKAGGKSKSKTIKPRVSDDPHFDLMARFANTCRELGHFSPKIIAEYDAKPFLKADAMKGLDFAISTLQKIKDLPSNLSDFSSYGPN